VSLYNESGNFLGPAIFDTKQEAQEYLKQYESKMLVRLTSINNASTNSNNNESSGTSSNDQKQQNNQKKRGEEEKSNNANDKRRKPGKRPAGRKSIKLKVFEESTLPPVNKPSFFFHKSN
jgi:hypothetical protein